jgi:hypothetical protein
MKDRSIANVNKEAYSQRAQAYYQNLKNSYSDRDYLQRPTEVLFPESFKVIRKA